MSEDQYMDEFEAAEFEVDFGTFVELMEAQFDGDPITYEEACQRVIDERKENRNVR